MDHWFVSLKMPCSMHMILISMACRTIIWKSFHWRILVKYVIMLSTFYCLSTIDWSISIHATHTINGDFLFSSHLHLSVSFVNISRCPKFEHDGAYILDWNIAWVFKYVLFFHLRLAWCYWCRCVHMLFVCLLCRLYEVGCGSLRHSPLMCSDCREGNCSLVAEKHQTSFIIPNKIRMPQTAASRMLSHVCLFCLIIYDLLPWLWIM